MPQDAICQEVLSFLVTYRV